MKISPFYVTLCTLSLFFSCSGDHKFYDRLTERECDSLLKTTALSSTERAKIVRQYAILHIPDQRGIGQVPIRDGDTCLSILREVIPLAPGNLKPELQITMLPFCLPKLQNYNQRERQQLRNMMSEIENSSLTLEQQARYLSYKAQYYTILRAPEQAFKFCEQSRNKFRKINDRQGEYNSLTQMSVLFFLQQDYINALRYCDSAFYLNNFTPSLQASQRLYSLYTQLYANINQYDKAIQAFQKSGRDSLDNSLLANLYKAGKHYDKALNIIQQQKKLQASNPYRLNYYLRSEAEIYEAGGEYDKAFATRSEAIRLVEENSKQINQKHPDLPGIPTAFVSIYASQAEYAWKNGNQPEAFKLLHKAEMLTLRTSMPSKENIRTMDLLTTYYRQTGQYHLALITSQRQDSLQTILNAQKQPEEYEKMLAQYELEMLDATIKKQKAEKRNLYFSHTFIGVGITLLSLLIVFAILYKRSLTQIKKLKNKQ